MFPPSLLLLALLLVGSVDALRLVQRSAGPSRGASAHATRLRMVDSDAVYDIAVKAAPAGAER